MASNWRSYYKRKYRRYYKKKYGSSYGKRSYGQMKAAKQQADQASFVMNIPTQLNVKNVIVTLQNQQREVGTFPLNIYDLLRKSEFYQSYANMYDEFKIDNIKVKLIPTKYNVTVGDTNNAGYQSFTVYTAWDRTGLNDRQLLLNTTTGTYDDNPINPSAGPDSPKNRDFIGKDADYDGIYCIVGSDITTYSSAESRQVSVGQNSSIVRWLKPKTLSEKSQWISTSQLKPWYQQYSSKDAAFKYIPTYDGTTLLDNVSQMLVLHDRSIAATLNSVSPAISNNPCFLEEDPTINFKPTLLVGIYPPDDEMVDNPRTVYFNVEAEVSCTFRGLRKSKVVTNNTSINPTPTPTPTPTPSVVNNEELNVFIDNYPITVEYTERDLEKGRTGFCPVNIEVGAPTFPLFYMDAEGKLFEQPVEHNGKYKMVPYISPEGTFPVTGFVPQYISNQSSEDYDININVPTDGSEPVQPIQPNTCYFNLSDYVIDQINATDDGKLLLPNGNQELMQAVSFDTGDKEYATDLVVDLSNVHVVKNNTASFNITPEVLDIVNSDGYQNEGQIVLPSDTIIKTMTNYDDDDKGFCTDIVINVNTLKNLIPQPTLNVADTTINQNDTYQIGNFDNDIDNVEIEATNKRNTKNNILSIRKLDKNSDSTTDTNYTIGEFTVNVPIVFDDIRINNANGESGDYFNSYYDNSDFHRVVVASGYYDYAENNNQDFDKTFQFDQTINTYCGCMVMILTSSSHSTIRETSDPKNLYIYVCPEISVSTPLNGIKINQHYRNQFGNAFTGFYYCIIMCGSDTHQIDEQIYILNGGYNLSTNSVLTSISSTFQQPVNNYITISDSNLGNCAHKFYFDSLIDLTKLKSRWPRVQFKSNYNPNTNPLV